MLRTRINSFIDAYWTYVRKKKKRITEKQPLVELKPQQKLAIKINWTRDNYPRDLPARSTHATKTGDYQVIFNRTCMPVPIAFVSRYKIATFSSYWIAICDYSLACQTSNLVARFPPRFLSRIFSFWRMRLSGWVTKLVLIYIALHRWPNTFVSQSI